MPQLRRVIALIRGIEVPLRSPAVLGERVGLDREGIEVLAAAGQLDAGNRLDAVGQAKRLDLGRPVEEPLVFGGRREFDVLRREVDDPVPRAAVVVPAGRRVRVVVGADPSGRVDGSFHHRIHFDGLPAIDLNPPLYDIVLGPQ